MDSFESAIKSSDKLNKIERIFITWKTFSKARRYM